MRISDGNVFVLFRRCATVDEKGPTDSSCLPWSDTGNTLLIMESIKKQRTAAATVFNLQMTSWPFQSCPVSKKRGNYWILFRSRRIFSVKFERCSDHSSLLGVVRADKQNRSEVFSFRVHLRTHLRNIIYACEKLHHWIQLLSHFSQAHRSHFFTRQLLFRVHPEFIRWWLRDKSSLCTD